MSSTSFNAYEPIYLPGRSSFEQWVEGGTSISDLLRCEQLVNFRLLERLQHWIHRRYVEPPLVRKATPPFSSVASGKVLAICLTCKSWLRIVSGGTDNHMMLVDLRPLSVTGAKAQTSLQSAGLVVNKNAIPYDPEPPMVTSGIRIGVPAVTTRGMDAADMERIGGYILDALKAAGSSERLRSVRQEVAAFASQFPAPGITDRGGRVTG